MKPEEIKELLIRGMRTIKVHAASAPVEGDEETGRLSRREDMEVAAALEAYMESVPPSDPRILELAARVPGMEEWLALLERLPYEARVPRTGSEFLDCLATLVAAKG